MKTIKIIIILFLIHFCKSFGQTNDYFPLNIGLKFKYQYHRFHEEVNCFLTNCTGYKSEENGYVFYTILGAEYQSDSTINWIVEQRDSITIVSGGADTTFDNYKVNEILKEYTTGNHKLESFSMKVWRWSNYSHLVFRYVDQVSDSIYKQINFPSEYYFKHNVGLTYYYSGFSNIGHSAIWDTIICNLIPSEISSINTIPEKINNYALHQNYPNPFNPSTKISFDIGHLTLVNLRVYDILGKEIVTLINDEKPAGNYEITWNAANLPSGMYFYRLIAGNYIATKKLLLLK